MEYNMKKLIKLLCALLSVLMLTVGFTACNDDGDYTYWQTYAYEANDSSKAKLAYVSELSFGSLALNVTEVWVNVSKMKDKNATITLLFASSTTSSKTVECPIYASDVKKSKDGWVQIFFNELASVSAKGVSIEIVNEMRINEIVFIKEGGTVISATFTQGGVKIVDSSSANLYSKTELEALPETNLAYNENPAFNVIDEQSKFPVEKIQTKK
jgi:hypothetical protein